MASLIQALNHAAQQWWVYVFHATWQGVLVAGFALALVYGLRRLPSPWRYALLMIALVKFVVPPVLGHKVGVFYWAGPVVVTPAGPATHPANSVRSAPPSATS